MTLHELQAETGLPRATAHRLATALETHGLLRRDDRGRFDLGPEIESMGRIATRRSPLAHVATPFLEALRDRTGQSVQLFVADGNHRRCVRSLQSPHGLQWVVPEGIVFPLGVGSAGRVLTGECGPHGWVESVAEREPGVASVSAPVRGVSDVVVAAVSVSGPIDRLTRSPGDRFGSRVVATADLVGAAVRNR